jgi:heme oxygenase
MNWSNELGMELDNLKAIESDKLQKEYYIANTERIKLFCEKLPDHLLETPENWFA